MWVRGASSVNVSLKNIEKQTILGQMGGFVPNINANWAIAIEAMRELTMPDTSTKD
jgi:hypothetical protein